MPPIDLPQVRARSADIAARMTDLPAALAAVRSLLEDYADLSRRPGGPLAGSAPANAFRTPMPVVRQVVTALRQPAQADPQGALALARELWAQGSREERRIAAEVIGLLATRLPAGALSLIETWLPEIESSATADALAEHGLGPLLARDPAFYLQNARRWVEHPHKWTRRFGLAALGALARDRHWDGVPEGLGVVRVVMDDADPEVRRAAVEALSRLLSKSPVEVKRFLLDHAARVNPNTQLILRAVMPRLSPEDQAELIRAMRA